jgi:hypothetical protein
MAQGLQFADGFVPEGGSEGFALGVGKDDQNIHADLSKFGCLREIIRRLELRNASRMHMIVPKNG